MEQRWRSSAAATSSGTGFSPYSAVPTADVTTSIQGPVSRPSGQVMGSARILVVDDDPGMLQTITWILKEHGYDVASAQGGAGMWEQLELRLPDLLLLDVIMPGADGFELLEQLKSDDRWRELPVLMVSSLPPEEATVKTLGLGAADFVRKPFRVRELLARIQAQLRMRAMLKSAREALRTTEEELLRARE